jgi:hypothetical protein
MARSCVAGSPPLPCPTSRVEPLYVECVRIDSELRARWPPQEPVGVDTSQLRYADVDGVRTLGGGSLPKRFDQPLDRNDAIRLEQEDREHRALFRLSERD